MARQRLHSPYSQITHAALHIYAAYGAKGVTMRRIAEAVGVTAPALYRHFKNKEELMNAVGELAATKLHWEFDKVAQRVPTERRFRATQRRAFEFLRDQPRMFELIAHRSARRKLPWLGHVKTFEAIGRDATARGVWRALAPQRHALSVWSQMCGIAMLREQGIVRTPEHLDEVWLDAFHSLEYGLSRESAAAAA